MTRTDHMKSAVKIANRMKWLPGFLKKRAVRKWRDHVVAALDG